MRQVAVIGIGQTRVEENWDLSLKELAGEAVIQAMNDAGVSGFDSIFIGNMMSGSANHQQHLGPLIADWVGMRFSEAYRTEAACSSGASAFRTALMAVASNEVDVAVAVGVEKMTDSPGSEITAELATAADREWEGDHGVSFVALNALIMQRYMFEYGWEHHHFAQFSINAHANAESNPNARFRKAITQQVFEKSTMIADPINVMDSSPMGDGAAAVVLVPLDKIHQNNNKKFVKIIASAVATDTISIHNRLDPLWLKAAESAAMKAYDQAAILPQEIDLFELHDAFTIMAALSLEANGFAERGQGPRLALDGDIKLTGRIPISTMGGLKARGHPVGATGMYQIVEVVQQLRGDSGGCQVKDAHIGMTQNIGGSGSNIISHIFSI